MAERLKEYQAMNRNVFRDGFHQYVLKSERQKMKFHHKAKESSYFVQRRLKYLFTGNVSAEQTILAHRIKAKHHCLSGV